MSAVPGAPMGETRDADLTGRWAVCSIGRIGHIEGRKDLDWGLSWVGTGIDGKPWASRTPRVICEADVALISPSFAALRSQLAEAQADTERLDWLAERVMENRHAELNYTDAWVEHGDYGSILSEGPAQFWLYDGGGEEGPTLRAAIDAARSTPERGDQEPIDLMQELAKYQRENGLTPSRGDPEGT